VLNLSGFGLKLDAKIIILALVGVALILIGGRMDRAKVEVSPGYESPGSESSSSRSEWGQGTGSSTKEEAHALRTYERLLENDLEAILSEVEGCGGSLGSGLVKSWTREGAGRRSDALPEEYR
jgi:hypothetical protein